MQWLAPATSTVWLPARLAYQRSKSGLMVRSLPATSIQLGLVLQAAVVIVAEKLSAKLSTCERAINAAWSAGTSAAATSVSWRRNAPFDRMIVKAIAPKNGMPGLRRPAGIRPD